MSDNDQQVREVWRKSHGYSRQMLYAAAEELERLLEDARFRNHDVTEVRDSSAWSAVRGRAPSVEASDKGRWHAAGVHTIPATPSEWGSDMLSRTPLPSWHRRPGRSALLSWAGPTGGGTEGMPPPQWRSSSVREGE